MYKSNAICVFHIGKGDKMNTYNNLTGLVITYIASYIAVNMRLSVESNFSDVQYVLL